MQLRVLVFCCSLLFGGHVLNAQQKGMLHLVSKSNNLPAPLRFNFSVNGQTYKWKGGTCMDIPVMEDSVHILLTDKRLLKKPVQNLHLPAEADMYVLIYFTFEGTFKEGLFAAEAICKSCYDEIRAQCRDKQ